MAPPQSRAVWVLALLSGLSLLSCAADCGQDCARCVYELLGQHTPLPPLACSLECGAALDSQTLRLCQETLLESDIQLPLEDNPAELEEAAEASPKEEEDAPEHLIAKKYGGFMKRYGGFMARRSSSTPEGAIEETASTDGQENIRNEILKILSAATVRGESGAEAVKRYGGFMRRGGAQSDALEAILGRGLEKRYGGFMRRVGRPEWLLDGSKGGGVFKRAWESSPPHKRYGGFMD
ncbi:proenkephalin-A-like [Eucyclogobius newberryi]|uniref:proenkephalin-A-like n=1 Tax=Eucyclogobius newberryi TaxID=166745 RepID=UPI003B5A6851